MAKPKPGKTKPKKKVLAVDMTGVEAGGKSIPDGNYEAEIVEVTEEESSNGNEQLKVVWQITDGKMKGTKIFDWVSLTPQSLWRLRGLLETIGQDVPDGMMNIDLDDLVGSSAQLEVTNDEYNGKKRPKVTGYGPIEAESEEAESEESEDETEDEAESEDESTDDEDESEDEAEGEDEAEEGEGEEEAETEEEEEKPKKPSGKKPSKPDPKPEPKTTGKAKIKVGAEVKFKNDKGKTVKGTVTAKDGDTIQVEDTKGEEWELDVSEVELA